MKYTYFFQLSRSHLNLPSRHDVPSSHSVSSDLKQLHKTGRLRPQIYTSNVTGPENTFSRFEKKPNTKQQTPHHPPHYLAQSQSQQAKQQFLTPFAKMVYTLVVHLYAKDDQECINKLIEKLKEASQVYSKDKETLGW